VRYDVRDKAEGLPTSSKNESPHANAVQATTDNVQTPRHEVRIHAGPGEPRSKLDRALILVDDDVVETDHGDLDTERRRKIGVG
jgi:hypothetical protein